MAAMTLPIPGTQYGPCLPSCSHTDCAQTRKDADEKCTLCGEIIGYDERCYRVEYDEATNVSTINWRHMICAVQKARGEPIERRVPVKRITNADFYKAQV